MPNLLAEGAVLGAGCTFARPRLGPRRMPAIGDFNTCRAYVDEPGAIPIRDTAHFLDLYMEFIRVSRGIYGGIASGRARIFLVQPPRQRLPHRPCVPVARPWRPAPARSATRMMNASPAFPTIRRSFWIYERRYSAPPPYSPTVIPGARRSREPGTQKHRILARFGRCIVRPLRELRVHGVRARTFGAPRNDDHGCF